jgi:signal transduction histidine kinase
LAFLGRPLRNLTRRTRLIGIISVVVASAISYGLFFYFQNITERSITNSLFQQQEQRQLDSTKAISEHISSDLDSIMSRLQGLANSVYLQQGDLSSNKTMGLLKQLFSSVTTANTVDRIIVLNRDNLSVASLAANRQQSFTGISFSQRGWVKEAEATLQPIFSNGFLGRDGKYRIAFSYPIINLNSRKYMGLVAAETSTVLFFQHYGNIHNITSQYLAVLDRRSVQLTHPIRSFIGTPFFGSYTQQITGHNEILNNLIKQVMSGQPGTAVYDFINGQRVTTGYPIFIQGKPTYFVFIITPTATVYSAINSIVSTERLEMFSLLFGITVAMIIVVLFLIKWNSSLESEVKRRTKELDKANERLKIHDKMQQEFINVAAHELKTPIQPILTITELLRSKINDSQQDGLLDVIIRNAKRLTKLSSEILDVTRIEGQSLELKKEQFNLNDVIVNAMDDIILSKEFGGKNIQFSYDPQDIFLQADKSRIVEVMSNLLSNAIKFTREGTVSISAEKVKDNNDGSDSVIVRVKDLGQGIDSHIFPRLFTKFVSMSYQGIGLGLFISKGIVEAHGGKIWAENNPEGKGATFTFSLPTDK